MSNIPLCFGIFAHAVTHSVDLFPAFAPFMSVALLGAHINDFKIVAPFLSVSLLVSHTVSFYRPFSRALPVHDTTSIVCGEDDDMLTAAAKERYSSIDTMECCRS